MRGLWLLLIIGCGAGGAPPTSPTSATPTTRQPPTVTPPPPAAADDAGVAATPAELPPKTACELDPASIECRCSEGAHSACLRVADGEFSRGDHQIAVTRVIGLCESQFAEACFLAATYFKRMHVTSKHGTTPAELRARGVKLHEDKCTAGNHDACHALARLVMQGKHVTADMKRGRALLEQSCTAKHLRSCVMLGNMHVVGQGAKKDLKRAKALFETACTADPGAGCAALGELLFKTDRTRALELYARACSGDDAEGCARAGEAAQKSGAVVRATEMLAKACELERAASCVAAGTLLSADPERARGAFQRACDADISAGCVGLAPLLAEGKGGPRNWGEGVELAAKACKAKTPKACGLHVRLKQSQPDVSCASIDACRELCDDERIPKACAAIAQIEMTDPDFGCQFAASSLEQACKFGDPQSCVMRGNSDAKAADAAGWYQLACTEKDKPACILRDAALADEGSKHERNVAIAALQRACKAKDHDACMWFADHLAVDKLNEAARLWRAGCDAGLGRACRQLARTNMESLIVVGDNSPRPPGGRRLAMLDKGCKLGDTQSCADARDERMVDTDVPMLLRCGVDVRWAL